MSSAPEKDTKSPSTPATPETTKAQADAERARAGLVSAVDDLTDAARAIKTEGVATAKRQAPKVGAAVGGLVSLRVLLKLLKRRRSRS